MQKLIDPLRLYFFYFCSEMIEILMIFSYNSRPNISNSYNICVDNFNSFDERDP